MKTKLIAITLCLYSLSVVAQSPPPEINSYRYNLCMSEGLGKGRGYTTPENYCQQWAGSNGKPRGLTNEIPCGASWNGSMVYMSFSQCENYMRAMAEQEAAQHKIWLAQQAAAAAKAKAAAAIHAPAFYNCTWSLLMGYDFGPQYDVQNVPTQIVATSLNNANAAANKYVQSLGWSPQGRSSCTYLVAVP